jgi:5-methylcytosine-specific restriction endonuclease McrA
MSPHASICKHGLRPKGTRCEECSREDNRRRNLKRQAHGRGEPWWPALRAKVLERDGFRCVDCGDYADLTADYLPGGVHSQNLKDYETRCRRCHGRVHATRQGRAGRRRKLGLEPPLPDPDSYPRSAPETTRSESSMRQPSPATLEIRREP